MIGHELQFPFVAVKFIDSKTGKAAIPMAFGDGFFEKTDKLSHPI
jgi:hypothetical protein